MRKLSLPRIKNEKEKKILVVGKRKNNHWMLNKNVI